MGDPFEQHREILAAAEKLLAGARGVPRIPIIELARLRNRLASLIRVHRLTEEQEIFGPFFRTGGLERLPHVAAALRQVQEEKARYSENIRHWTLQAVEKDWDGYAEAVALRVASLRDLIRFEEEHIYGPILDYLANKKPGERIAAMR